MCFFFLGAHDPNMATFDDLPDEVLAHVFRALPCAVRRGVLLLVCRRWCDVAGDAKAIGRSVCMNNYSDAGAWRWRARTPLSSRRWYARAAVSMGYLHCLADALAQMRQTGRSVGSLCAVARRAVRALALPASDPVHGAHRGDWRRQHPVDREWRLCRGGERRQSGGPRLPARRGVRVGRVGVSHGGPPWTRRVPALPARKRLSVERRSLPGGVTGSHLECLAYMDEHGCPVHEGCMREAAAYGHIECLRYLHRCGRGDTSMVLYRACERGQLDCVRYAHENNLDSRDADAYIAAAKCANRLDILRYLHDNGYAWSAGVFALAVKTRFSRDGALPRRE